MIIDLHGSTGQFVDRHRFCYRKSLFLHVGRAGKIIKCSTSWRRGIAEYFLIHALYCVVLYCIVSYCIVLYCIVSYCIVLYCIVLYCIVLYCNVIMNTCSSYFFCLISHHNTTHHIIWFVNDLIQHFMCYP